MFAEGAAMESGDSSAGGGGGDWAGTWDGGGTEGCPFAVSSKLNMGPLPVNRLTHTTENIIFTSLVASNQNTGRIQIKVLNTLPFVFQLNEMTDWE